MRLIDADKLKKDILDLQDCYNGFSDTYDKACIIGVVDEQPSVQPERPKGEWIDETDGGFVECPFCHTKTKFIENIEDLRFCFWCGADMSGEESDCDYERAVEQFEHDMLYEPTFNPDDESM